MATYRENLAWKKGKLKKNNLTIFFYQEFSQTLKKQNSLGELMGSNKGFEHSDCLMKKNLSTEEESITITEKDII